MLRVAWLSALILFFLASPARAEEPSSLGKEATLAWQGGEHEESERLHRILIERGGLSPKELVEAYVHLGTSRIALGKKTQAIAAFRAAAVLDGAFTIPAGHEKSGDAAEQAKKDVSNIGSIVFHGDVPDSLEAGQDLAVAVTLDKAHVGIIHRVSLVATEKLTTKEFSDQQKPAEKLSFTVPKSLFLPGATVRIRIFALDKFENQAAAFEKSVKITFKEEKSDKGAQRKSFWETPWPYILGGVALAAGGFSAYYFWLRPTDAVSIGPVGVRER